MKILITGGSGFIGQAILKKLKKENILLLSKSLNHNKKTTKNIKLKYISYKNLKFQIECDILIHAGGVTPQKFHKYSYYKKNNYIGLKNIIRNVRIKDKIIFLSTTDIYKNKFTNGFAKENNKINFNDLSDYSKSKFLCENYLQNLDTKIYGFKKIVLRLPGIVGKNNHNNFISSIVKNVSEKKKISFFGAENFFNNIYHVDSLADFIQSILRKKFIRNFNIINIATSNPIKIKNIFNLISKKVFIEEKSSVKKKIYSFTINISKLRKHYKNISTKKTLYNYFRSSGIS